MATLKLMLVTYNLFSSDKGDRIVGAIWAICAVLDALRSIQMFFEDGLTGILIITLVAIVFDVILAYMYLSKSIKIKISIDN